MRRHILLEIEVSERVSIRELEEFAELGVRKNNATILLVLKTVSADVGGHLLCDISSRHKSAVVLSEEISELIGNLGGLDETTGSAIALVLVLLCFRDLSFFFGGRLVNGVFVNTTCDT